MYGYWLNWAYKKLLYSSNKGLEFAMIEDKNSWKLILLISGIY